MYTPYHSKYFATQLTLKRPSNSIDSLASSLAGAKVDLNPHQIDAALFAFNSPISNGVLLADEVGLGKTIEAGIVIAQLWAERKRKILLIVPAALRNQWLSELEEKFYIKSIILESKNFNQSKKRGTVNPFKEENRVVICSYNFAAQKNKELARVNWDLVVIDEAHRLRNVYKPSNVIGNRLKEGLKGRKKLLLTATPLQNSLMELYGIVSIIDEHVFGDAKTFKGKYVNVENQEVRNVFLKSRLQQFCKRTLRKQVVEYVPYTKRIPILQKYESTKEEEDLYNGVARYLQSDKLYALPNSQRKLMTTILWKLLASSSFAISGTLQSLINRLQNMLDGINSELNIDDYDNIDEFKDEYCTDEDEDTNSLLVDRDKINIELGELTKYLEVAKSIQHNTKGENLLQALEKGFEKAAELGAKRKAVIFTESRRTQEYIYNLLYNNGHKDKIVFLNGTNNDEGSKKIYKEWVQRHNGEDIVSGSKQADIKAAIVEEFKERANILIGTEAAAEGINLQFCSLLVNYDLPWNPQRIEQRIGRCHRYGQKNDVVVINFLNTKNDADKRVYELLDQKFKLFEGVFGSSDEVLGSIESGMDFEKRISEIYQNCRNADDIKQAFDNIQDELEEKIKVTMSQTREKLLENFDEDVSQRLKICNNETEASMNKYERWLYKFILSEGGEKFTPIDNTRLYYSSNDDNRGYYNLEWKRSEQLQDHFLRKENSLCNELIVRALARNLKPAHIVFNYSESPHKISFFEKHCCKSGWIVLDKLEVNSFEIQEHLLMTGICDDGTELDYELCEKLLELPAKDFEEINNQIPPIVNALRDKLGSECIKRIKNENMKYYIDECEKLDEWTEDLKEGLESEIKQIEKQIAEFKKAARLATTLEETVRMKGEANKLEKLKSKKIQNLFNDREEIDKKNDKLQEDILKRLNGTNRVKHVFAIRFEIV